MTFNELAADPFRREACKKQTHTDRLQSLV